MMEEDAVSSPRSRRRLEFQKRSSVKGSAGGGGGGGGGNVWGGGLGVSRERAATVWTTLNEKKTGAFRDVE